MHKYFRIFISFLLFHYNKRTERKPIRGNVVIPLCICLLWRDNCTEKMLTSLLSQWYAIIRSRGRNVVK